ncbi:MAG TPA: efflux RND transporter periplasmic adaptor subunit [Steroidobacteraceae bacterium]
METYDHTPTARGRAFLWGGIALGLILLVVVFTHGLGLFGARPSAAEAPLLLHQGDKIVVPDSSSLRARLSLAPAAAEQVSGKLILPGIIESDPARTATVVTPVAGRVVQLKVALGDRVTRGQVLLMIESADLAQALADDAKATDALRLAQKNLQRQEAQAKLGALSDRDLDQVRNDREQAAAESTRAQAHLKAIGATTEDAASARLALRAPISGSVTTLAVSAGSVINDLTQPLLSIADLSTVWVTALVPEKDLGAIAKGQKADVTLAAYPDQVLHGEVLFVSDVLEADSRRDKLRIAFPNPHYALKPNMFASVTLLAAPQSRVVLPASALLMNNDRTVVFVATAPWTFERRVIEPELAEGATVAIRSGVTAGEQVVIKGGILLND